MKRGRLRSIAALAALLALVLVPVLHGAHAPHLERSDSIQLANASFDASARAESAGCPICFASSQARTALATPALLAATAASVASPLPSPRAELAPCRAPHAPFPPRAPPVRV